MAKKITYERLYHITLFYLQRYDASCQKIRAMLQRRLKKEALNQVEIPQNANELIEEVIKKVVSLGYVDDIRYAQNQIRQLSLSGKSQAFIIQKLKTNLIPSDTIKELIEDYDGQENTDDLTRARRWLKHHSKGAFRSKNTTEYYQKDLAALGRAGFSYAISKEALEDVKKPDDIDDDACY